MNNPDRLIRRPEVSRITGMTRYLIDLLEHAGAFPSRLQVGARAVFWSEAEVLEFIETAKQNRLKAASKKAVCVKRSEAAKP